MGLSATTIQAAHIIGGEVTYDCLGPGSVAGTNIYQFYMFIYRDCQGGGADFDSGPFGAFDAHITLYEQLDDGSSQALDIITLGAPVVTGIDPSGDNPCLIPPPFVCVEEGVYRFPQLELPTRTGSYFVSYQRCCRNNTISNIFNPGETGATYAMELTATAQSECNSSPTFTNFPPPVICSGEPLVFDHSATDTDGDQLVYEFCLPLKGGGVTGDDTSDPDGIAPNPDSPPPYLGVQYDVPAYNTEQPLGEEAGLDIDPNTGMITGTPTTNGQFVIGICVSEYRAGILLSTVRRDFQFNVTSCDPLVSAQVDDAEEIEPGIYELDLCGPGPLTIVNQSVQEEFIQDYVWSIDLGDTLITDTENWNLTVDFAEVGTYEARLQLNPGSNCADSALVRIHVFPELNADFSFDYDTCKVGGVAFTDQSVANQSTIESWLWEFETYADTLRNPIAFFDIAGEQRVRLRIEDDNGCQDSETQIVRYFPVPELIVVAPNTFLGCQPAEIKFLNLSTPINDAYEVNWTFGDGEVTTAISPSHIYQDTGVFDVGLEIISPIGCQTDTLFPNLITVEPSPVANFTFSPDQVTSLRPEILLSDRSSGAAIREWRINDDRVGALPEFAYTFADTGLQVVQLLVQHISGCRDTMTQRLDIVPEVTYFLPNAFTPNNDGTNDVFRGTGYLPGITDFAMLIWNRWGELVFESTDTRTGWNGTRHQDGQQAQPGMYVYQIQFTGPRGQPFRYEGYITLIR